MLRYLWDVHGSYLWTDRHFEPVMRYIIESEWVDGIKIMLTSENTHQIVRALTSNERSYFIENMIGNISSIKNEEIRKTLKEQLSEKPYAGITTLTMLDNFDTLNEDDLKYWELSMNNLY